MDLFKLFFVTLLSTTYAQSFNTPTEDETESEILEPDSDNLQQEPEILKSNLDNIQQEHENWQPESDKWQLGPENLNSKSDDFQQDHVNWETESDTWKTELENVNSKSDDSQQDHVNWGPESDTWQKELENLNSKSDDSQQDYVNWGPESDTWQKELENLNSKSGDFQQVHENWEPQIDNWQQEPENLNSRPDDFQQDHVNWGPESDTWQKEQENLNSKSGNFQQVHENLEPQIDNWQQEPENLNSRPDDFQHNHENWEPGTNIWQQETENLKTEADHWQQEPENLEPEPDNWQKKPENLEPVHDNWEQEQDNVESEPHYLQKEAKNLKSQPDQRQQEQENWEQEPDHWQQEPEKLKSELEYLRDASEHLWLMNNEFKQKDTVQDKTEFINKTYSANRRKKPEDSKIIRINPIFMAEKKEMKCICNKPKKDGILVPDYINVGKKRLRQRKIIYVYIFEDDDPVLYIPNESKQNSFPDLYVDYDDKLLSLDSNFNSPADDDEQNFTDQSKPGILDHHNNFEHNYEEIEPIQNIVTENSPINENVEFPLLETILPEYNIDMSQITWDPSHPNIITVESTTATDKYHPLDQFNPVTARPKEAEPEFPNEELIPDNSPKELVSTHIEDGNRDVSPSNEKDVKKPMSFVYDQVISPNKIGGEYPIITPITIHDNPNQLSNPNRYPNLNIYYVPGENDGRLEEVAHITNIDQDKDEKELESPDKNKNYLFDPYSPETSSYLRQLPNRSDKIYDIDYPKWTYKVVPEKYYLSQVPLQRPQNVPKNIWDQMTDEEKNKFRPLEPKQILPVHIHEYLPSLDYKLTPHFDQNKFYPYSDQTSDSDLYPGSDQYNAPITDLPLTYSTKPPIWYPDLSHDSLPNKKESKLPSDKKPLEAHLKDKQPPEQYPDITRDQQISNWIKDLPKDHKLSKLVRDLLRDGLPAKLITELMFGKKRTQLPEWYTVSPDEKQPSKLYTDLPYGKPSEQYPDLPKDEKLPETYTVSPYEKKTSIIYSDFPYGKPTKLYSDLPKDEKLPEAYTVSPYEKKPSIIYSDFPYGKPTEQYSDLPRDEKLPETYTVSPYEKKPSIIYSDFPYGKPTEQYSDLPKDEKLPETYTVSPYEKKTSIIYSDFPYGKPTELYSDLPKDEKLPEAYTVSPYEKKPSIIYSDFPYGKPTEQYSDLPRDEKLPETYTVSPYEKKPSIIYSDFPHGKPTELYSDLPKDKKLPEAYTVSPYEIQPSTIYIDFPYGKPTEQYSDLLNEKKLAEMYTDLPYSNQPYTTYTDLPNDKLTEQYPDLPKDEKWPEVYTVSPYEKQPSTINTDLPYGEPREQEPDLLNDGKSPEVYAVSPFENQLSTTYSDLPYGKPTEHNSELLKDDQLPETYTPSPNEKKPSILFTERPSVQYTDWMKDNQPMESYTVMPYEKDSSKHYSTKPKHAYFLEVYTVPPNDKQQSDQNQELVTVAPNEKPSSFSSHDQQQFVRNPELSKDKRPRELYPHLPDIQTSWDPYHPVKLENLYPELFGKFTKQDKQKSVQQRLQPIHSHVHIPDYIWSKIIQPYPDRQIYFPESFLKNLVRPYKERPKRFPRKIWSKMQETDGNRLPIILQVINKYHNVPKEIPHPYWSYIVSIGPDYLLEDIPDFDWSKAIDINDLISTSPEHIHDNSFDNWFEAQAKNLPIKHADNQTPYQTIYQRVKDDVEKIFEDNAILFTDGEITDNYGRRIDPKDLIIRPILIGNSISYEALQLVAGSKLMKIPKDIPFLESLLVSLQRPKKILGIIPLGFTIPAQNKNGNCDLCNLINEKEIDRSLPTVIPIPKVDSKISKVQTKSDTEKSKATEIYPSLWGDIIDATKPILGEDPPRYRIIGGNPAMRTTNLNNKGRSGYIPV